MSGSIVYVGENTHAVELVDCKDQDGVVQTTATVQCTAITDLDGATVSGVALPLNMPHIANGLYRGIVSHTAAFVRNREYWVTIKAVSFAGFRGEWREKCRAIWREE